MSTVVVLISVMMAAASVQAHLLWINADQRQAQTNESVWIEIGWGHEYPRHLAMTDQWLDETYLVDPQGKRLPMDKIFPAFYRFNPTTEGTYQVVSKLKPGFLSITTEGHKLGSKKDVQDVVSCRKYIMTAKTLIQVGKNNEGFQAMNKEPLQIVPQANPADLKVGDTVPLKVTFQGKPLAEAKIEVTNTEHTPPDKMEWLPEHETDSEGVVRVKITSKGQWLFKVNHKVPYPDTAEADKYSYTTSLTLGI